MITGDTTLDASWSRAYVKLSSSTVNIEIHGTHMLSRGDIITKYTKGGANNSFYILTSNKNCRSR